MTHFNAGGVIPGPAHTPAGIIAFERYVTPEQVRRFGQESARHMCRHTGAVPVESVMDGELLAWLCPSCDTQLDPDPRGWADPHGQPVVSPPKNVGSAPFVSNSPLGDDHDDR